MCMYTHTCVCVCVLCIMYRDHVTPFVKINELLPRLARDRRYWPCETRGVARIVLSPPSRCPALTTTRKPAVCHNSFRNRPCRSSEEGSPNAPARPTAHRCTLSTGDGAAFIGFPSRSSPRNSSKKTLVILARCIANECILNRRSHCEIPGD